MANKKSIQDKLTELENFFGLNNKVEESLTEGVKRERELTSKLLTDLEQNSDVQAFLVSLRQGMTKVSKMSSSTKERFKNETGLDYESPAVGSLDTWVHFYPVLSSAGDDINWVQASSNRDVFAALDRISMYPKLADLFSVAIGLIDTVKTLSKQCAEAIPEAISKDKIDTIMTGLHGTGKTYLDGDYRQGKNDVQPAESVLTNELLDWLDRNIATITISAPDLPEYRELIKKLTSKELPMAGVYLHNLFDDKGDLKLGPAGQPVKKEISSEATLKDPKVKIPFELTQYMNKNQTKFTYNELIFTLLELYPNSFVVHADRKNPRPYSGAFADRAEVAADTVDEGLHGNFNEAWDYLSKINNNCKPFFS